MILKKRTFKTIIIITFLIIAAFSNNLYAADKKTVKVAFFEAGESPTHSLLRSEFKRVLAIVSPENIEIIFTPTGYKTGSWDQDSCKILASQLSEQTDIDIIITFGPWVVEDLLQVKCQKPIIAMHRVDPASEGLLNSESIPVVNNLTVWNREGKIEQDIFSFYEMTSFKKLGVLYFPSNDEQEKIISKIKQVGSQLNFEVFSAEGYDNKGTYAFFKAYQKLRANNIDALYLFPIWGIDLSKLKEFLKLPNSDKIPTFTYEGIPPVQRGALASNASLSYVSEAYYNAYKFIEIANGVMPSSLSTNLPERPTMVINEETAHLIDFEITRAYYANTNIITAPQSEEIMPITITEAIMLAISQNPQILADFDAITAAEANRSEKKSALYPQLDLSISAFHLDDNTVNNSHYWLDNDGYQATINLTQNIFDLPSFKEIKAASKKIELTENMSRQTKLNLEFMVLLTYIDNLQITEEYELYKQNREHFNLYREIAQAQAEQLKKDSIDSRRWENEWLNASSKITDLHYKNISANILLNSFLNLPPENELIFDSTDFNLKFMLNEFRALYNLSKTKKNQESLLNFLISEGLQSNPEKKIINSQLSLAQINREKNKATIYPTLKVRGSYTLGNRLADDLPLFEEKSNSWSLFGELSWSVFDDGFRSQEKKKLKAKYSEIEYRRDALSLKIMSDISRSFYEILNNSDQLPSVFEARKLSRGNLESILMKYEKNNADYLELIAVQKEAFETQLKFIQKRYDYFRSVVKLVNKLGLSVAETNRSSSLLFIDLLKKYNSKN